MNILKIIVATKAAIIITPDEVLKCFGNLYYWIMIRCMMLLYHDSLYIVILCYIIITLSNCNDNLHVKCYI